MLLYAKIKEQSILRNCIKTSQKIDILFEELFKEVLCILLLYINIYKVTTNITIKNL
jgi:hypothetical protein